MCVTSLVVTGVDAVLETIPHTLATVTIQDSLGEVLRLPPGVADRMRNGMGSYITATDRESPIHTLAPIPCMGATSLISSNPPMSP